MGDRFPRKVDRDLRRAGWFPGRSVDTTVWREQFPELEMHPAAERFLAEFGGLAVDIHGPGRTSAREPFVLDPSLCDEEDDRFEGWSKKLGLSLFPLGELDHGRFLLGIDQDGVIYLVETWVARFGPFDEGLIALCVGVRPEEVSRG